MFDVGLFLYIVFIFVIPLCLPAPKTKTKKHRTIYGTTRDPYYTAYLVTGRPDLLAHPDREQAFWDAKTDSE